MNSKKYNLTQKEIFDCMDQECVETQVKLDSNFNSTFSIKCEKIVDLEIGLAQYRRFKIILNRLSKGYRKIRFDFLILDVMFEFLKATMNEKQDEIRTASESMIRIPKREGNVKAKNIKGLNTIDTERYEGGRRPGLCEIVERTGFLVSDYVNLLKRTAKL